MPAGVIGPAQLSMEPAGKCTSHLVKYSHHPDGRAHFSQDGKILTRVKRHSLPLASVSGHLFTANIQGLTGFSKAKEPRDSLTPGPERTNINFEIGDTPLQAFKIVGRYYLVKQLSMGSVGTPSAQVGPVVPLKDRDGKFVMGFLVGSPYSSDALIVLSAATTAQLNDRADPTLIFSAGFDDHATACDPASSSSFLVMMYPVDSFEELAARIGSVDLANNWPLRSLRLKPERGLTG